MPLSTFCPRRCWTSSRPPLITSPAGLPVGRGHIQGLQAPGIPRFLQVTMEMGCRVPTGTGPSEFLSKWQLRDEGLKDPRTSQGGDIEALNGLG